MLHKLHNNLNKNRCNLQISTRPLNKEWIQHILLRLLYFGRLTESKSALVNDPLETSRFENSLCFSRDEVRNLPHIFSFSYCVIHIVNWNTRIVIHINVWRCISNLQSLNNQIYIYYLSFAYCSLSLTVHTIKGWYFISKNLILINWKQ